MVRRGDVRGVKGSAPGERDDAQAHAVSAGEDVASTSSDASRLSRSARAHLLQFPARPNPAPIETGSGRRMLGAFLLVGLVLHPALQAALAAAQPGVLPLARTAVVGVLLVAFIGLQRWMVGGPWDALGLRPLRRWSLEERLYLIQVVPLAAVVFAFLFRDRLGDLLAQHGTLGFAVYSVATGLAWGMVQEFVYRGWLQTVLVSRFGAAIGILASNTVFTLGPLHASSYLGRSDPQWATLAAVFGIGLLFAIIYRRSGNLWLPAMLHGLWPLNMS